MIGNSSEFKGKTFFVTGASRGIGKAIALKLASHGAQVAIVAKSIKEDSRLGGTIYSTAEEINKTGGAAIAIACDIRDEEQVIHAVQQTTAIFGGIDGLVNNASAIWLGKTTETEMKRFDLMFDINVRGTFVVTKHCIPFLEKSSNPHIISLSPPRDIDIKWFSDHLAYTISKLNMTLLTMGWAEELKEYGIAANTLWPATTIATAAVRNLLGGEAIVQKSRRPEIVADAAYYIFNRSSRKCTGNNFIDEEVLRKEGVSDLGQYAVNANEELQKDIFIP